MKKHKGLLIVLAVLIVLAALIITKYNKLATLDNDVDAAYSQVQIVVKRRADLIPNLVNVVKGYASHEEDTFLKVTEARSGIANSKNITELSKANNELSNAISKLNLVVERYPDLKANENFLDLQAQLEGTENRISAERGRYNDTVKEYNKVVRSFPMNIFAKMFGFEKKAYFEINKSDEQVPEVNF